MKSFARIAAMTALAVAYCAATAQTKTIDFTQQLVNAMEIPLTEPGKDGKVQPIELWEIAINALEANTPGEQVTGVKKFETDELARKIYKTKKCSLTEDELKTVKERIGQQYPPMIVGAAWRILDGSAPPAEEKK